MAQFGVLAVRPGLVRPLDAAQDHALWQNVSQDHHILTTPFQGDIPEFMTLPQNVLESILVFISVFTPTRMCLMPVERSPH
jgi:hypothetical protein